MKHLKKIADRLQFERTYNPTMSMEGIATEGIKEWLSSLLKFFTSKPKSDDGIDPKKKSEPHNAIHDKNASGDAIIKYINATYLNDQWLSSRIEVKHDLSTDGQMATLTINGKVPPDIFKSIDDYLRAIEKYISDTRPDRVKFYQEAAKIAKKLEKNQTPEGIQMVLDEFNAMTYPLDKWSTKAPNYKTHVGGVELIVKDNKFYENNHYTFSIHSNARVLIGSLTKEQVKQAGKVMIELVTNIYRGQYGMFDEVSEGMYFDEVDIDALYSEDVDDSVIDKIMNIEYALIDKRDVNWSAITLPYVTSLQHLLLALDFLIKHSLKPV